METYAFLHFTVNTFTDKEWGYGDEDPAIFNPTEFDADAIVAALAAGGMKGVILTCKHHDGFCLWPTETTDHSVRTAPGAAARAMWWARLRRLPVAHGLKFGVYLSPWDRNNAKYGTPDYIDIYREQLRELLTHYGPIFEVWHDGANGGDGYYGGAREKRAIDKQTYYRLARNLGPCPVAAAGCRDLQRRWSGHPLGRQRKRYRGRNLLGRLSPRWARTADRRRPAMFATRESTDRARAMRGKLAAAPSATSPSGRAGSGTRRENDKVKTPQQLFDLYFKSVGAAGAFC